MQANAVSNHCNSILIRSIYYIASIIGYSCLQFDAIDVVYVFAIGLCSMDMEIVYYEQDSGVLQKVAEMMVQTKNGASLDQLCREALQRVSRSTLERGVCVCVCVYLEWMSGVFLPGSGC